MKRKKIGESILQWLFVNYLTLLDKTMHIEWEVDTQFGDSQIFGFWHGGQLLYESGPGEAGSPDKAG